jgi:NodT family efflux transporter outer membrane factor (OMF) lipoprotein
MRHLFVFISLFILSACASTFEPPKAHIPQSYTHSLTPNPNPNTSGPNQPPQSVWWQAFGDPKLNELIETVLLENINLTVAGQKLYQARLRAGLSTLDKLPSKSGSVGGRSLEGDTTYNANLALSYEVDLWGKLQASQNAAKWEAKASEQEVEATRQSLIATTAELYWRLAFINQQISSTETSLGYQNQILNLVLAQYKVGARSGLEVSEARQTVANQDASLDTLRQQRVEYRAALSLLRAGQALSAKQEIEGLPQTPMPLIREGIPAELLANRPDLMASENRLRKSLAQLDQARAAFYPVLNLTGQEGHSSRELSDLLKNPVSTLSLSLSLPFLDYPRLKLNSKISQSQYETAVNLHKQTLWQAISEVDTALSNQTRLEHRARLLNQAQQEASKAAELTKARFVAGKVSLRIWLDAEERLRAAKLSYETNRLAQYVNQSTLYRALGGVT